MQDIPWGALVIVLPLAGALACFLSLRRTHLLGLMTALGVVVCVADLGWQVVEQGAQRYAVGGWGAPLGIDLYADGNQRRLERSLRNPVDR